MDLSIIIVNWKSKDYLRKCVASVFAPTREIEFEVIVIDSASFDGAGEMLAQEFPQVRFIQSQENLGFARANNRACEIAQGEVLLFLNPDTEAVGDAISQLHAVVTRLPQAGAIGCRLLNGDGSVQTSCVQSFPTVLNQVLSAEALRRLTPRSSLWGMKPIFDARPEPVAAEMISGACLMMRRSVFQKIGGFSTDYFMYAEDVDLCFKAQSAGFTNYYYGTVDVIHYGGGSSQQAGNNFATLMMAESISRFLEKTRGRTYRRLYQLAMGGAALVRVVVLLALWPVVVLRSSGNRWRCARSKWWAICSWGWGRLGTSAPRSPSTTVG